MSAIHVRGLTHGFGRGDGRVVALHHVDLTVADGEFVCLVGASGCGKSTLLSLLAGLERPQSGEVEIHGHRAALVFQEAALFPWLTAQENIELPLRLRGVGTDERRAKASRMLARVHMAGAESRRPHELSGGMRQRVALGRALVQEPEVLLMDEPFGALDAITRDRLHDELESIWSTTQLSVLFVTHDAREAVRLADRVLVMSSRPGRIASEVAVGLDRPRRADDPRVAALVGDVLRQLHLEAADAA